MAHFKNCKTSTMSFWRQFQHFVIVIPAAEKAHSLETEDAMMDKQSQANDAQVGRHCELIYGEFRYKRLEVEYSTYPHYCTKSRYCLNSFFHGFDESFLEKDDSISASLSLESSRISISNFDCPFLTSLGVATVLLWNSIYNCSSN
jgi:hypothetical protein